MKRSEIHQIKHRILEKNGKSKRMNIVQIAKTKSSPSETKKKKKQVPKTNQINTTNPPLDNPKFTINK